MLELIVPEAVIDEPALIDLAGRFQRRSPSNIEHPLGTLYRFSASGELKFTQEAYQGCLLFGCILNGGMFFVEQPLSILDAQVPVAFPDSVDAEGAQMIWKNYLFSHWITDTGTVLMRAAHHLMTTGLSDDIRKIWHDNFGGLLTLAEGRALMPTVSE